MSKVLQKLKEEGDIKPVDGKCPEGMVLSEDGSACLSPKGEEKQEEAVPVNTVTEFKIGHKDPQFVVDGPIRLRIEANKLVEFEDGEAIELVENKLGNLQIGTTDNVIEIDNEKMVSEFLETVTHKDDVKNDDKEVTVAEAIKSNMDPTRVAKMIIEQHCKEEGALTKLREGNTMLRINVRRKIRSLRTVGMKAAAVRKAESKNDSFILHKATELIK